MVTGQRIPEGKTRKDESFLLQLITDPFSSSLASASGFGVGGGGDGGVAVLGCFIYILAEKDKTFT